ncbi:hypothetical protein [Notoacmeibacter marinus]|nr:hypothetical protein [Notoacmeibacter marinus]
MNRTRLTIIACAASLSAGAAVSHAQTETGPGGYVYEYQSPSIMLIKPEGWEPSKAEAPEPPLLRPIMPTDLYEDEELTRTSALEEVIGRPDENALGPILAAQRAEERQRRLAAQEAEKGANQLADTPVLPDEGVDRQTTAALPDADEAAQTDVTVQNDVEIIGGDGAEASASAEEPPMDELAKEGSGPAIVEVETKNASANEGAPSEPEFSKMKMRY